MPKIGAPAHFLCQLNWHKGFKTLPLTTYPYSYWLFVIMSWLSWSYVSAKCCRLCIVIWMAGNSKSTHVHGYQLNKVIQGCRKKVKSLDAVKTFLESVSICPQKYTIQEWWLFFCTEDWWFNCHISHKPCTGAGLVCSRTWTTLISVRAQAVTWISPNPASFIGLLLCWHVIFWRS